METVQAGGNLLSQIPFNLFDYILIGCFFFYIYEEINLGAKAALSHVAAITGSFVFALLLYAPLSKLIIQILQLSKGVSDAVSFFAVAAIAYIVISRIIFHLSKQAMGIVPRHFSKGIALVAGALSFVFIASFIISIFLSFPVATPIKTSIKNSVTGKFLLTRTQHIELAVKRVFSSTIDETLNFLTVKPDSDGTVELHFTTDSTMVDATSEQKMLQLVNRERKKRGLSELVIDTKLREAARIHAKDMFKRGYFSHYTPEGYTPFDRLEQLNISYLAAAENLAYAPDVELAHSGLMKSEGHRKNILDPAFQKIGIGILDGGIYGKMFVQEFTN